jgi:hypothetical protein
VTRNNYLELSPNALQVGDEAYVINGSKVPFVLRKSDHPSPNRQSGDESQMMLFSIFRLVGDCYVHNIMYEDACHNAGSSAIPFVLY